jgi:hypothetical protein
MPDHVDRELRNVIGASADSRERSADVGERLAGLRREIVVADEVPAASSAT